MSSLSAVWTIATAALPHLRSAPAKFGSSGASLAAHLLSPGCKRAGPWDEKEPFAGDTEDGSIPFFQNLFFFFWGSNKNCWAAVCLFLSTNFGEERAAS